MHHQSRSGNYPIDVQAYKARANELSNCNVIQGKTSYRVCSLRVFSAGDNLIHHQSISGNDPIDV